MKYRITHKETGQDHGVYEGRTPTEAIVTMHQDAGYDVRLEPQTNRIYWPDKGTRKLCGEDCWQAKELCIVIDHERYGGEAVEFSSLVRAQRDIRKLGPDWANTELCLRPDGKVVDERDEVVGEEMEEE